MQLKDIVTTKGKEVEPFEYLCRSCRQLRLSFVETTICNNCGSTEIIIGKVGSLNRSMLMSWKEKMKEWGGADITFLSEDGETIKFIVVGEPVLLEGEYKGKASQKIGAPVVTEDGYQLFIVGKRLARKISKHEPLFPSALFMAVRHGDVGDPAAAYSLTIIDDKPLSEKLFKIKDTDIEENTIQDSVVAAQKIMKE